MKATKNELVTALRDVADWIDSHQIDGESVVNISVDGWAGATLHVEPEWWFEHRVGVVEHDGHGLGLLDGLKVVTLAGRGRRLDSAGSGVCEEARAAE